MKVEVDVLGSPSLIAKFINTDYIDYQYIYNLIVLMVLEILDRAQEPCESRGDRPGLLVPNSP